jgi:hypothetical protein
MRVTTYVDRSRHLIPEFQGVPVASWLCLLCPQQAITKWSQDAHNHNQNGHEATQRAPKMAPTPARMGGLLEGPGKPQPSGECAIVARMVVSLCDPPRDADRWLPSPGHRRGPRVQGQPRAACACFGIDQNGNVLDRQSTATDDHLADGSHSADDKHDLSAAGASPAGAPACSSFSC